MFNFTPCYLTSVGTPVYTVEGFGGKGGEIKISLLYNIFMFGVGDIAFHSGILVIIFCTI